MNWRTTPTGKRRTLNPHTANAEMSNGSVARAALIIGTVRMCTESGHASPLHVALMV